MRWLYVFLVAASASAAWAQDQDFQWARSSGGINDDTASSVVVDSAGSVFTAGSFRSVADFDSGPGTYILTAQGSSPYNPDVFITKRDSSGQLVWAKQLGGPGSEWGSQLALDASGNIYVAGIFNYTADFDPDPNVVYNLTPTSAEVFVVKLSPSGGLMWARRLGGGGHVYPGAITVDPEGCPVVTGTFSGPYDFDPDPVSTYNLTGGGNDDAFVWKLSSGGNFVWAKQLGGPLGAFGLGIATDAVSDVFTTGYFVGTVDFDPGPGVFDASTSFGLRGGFVSKLDRDGNFVWAKAMMGADPNSEGSAQRIAVDPAGNVSLTGYFAGTFDFDPGPGIFNLSASISDSDTFVSKLDASGNFVWAGALRGTENEFPFGVAIDALGNVYASGRFGGTMDFDPGPGVYNLTAGAWRTFLFKLDASGQFVWAKSVGGHDFEEGYDIHLDADGNVYTAGAFSGTADFISGAGSFLLTSAGQKDVFVAKFSQTPVLRFSTNALAAWNPLFGEVAYNVYRSDNGAPGTFTCLAGFGSDPSVVDLEVPAPGGLFAYVVTTVTASGHEGTMGFQAVQGTPTVERPNSDPCAAAVDRSQIQRTLRGEVACAVTSPFARVTVTSRR